MKAITLISRRWISIADEFFLPYLPVDLELMIKWVPFDSQRFMDEDFYKIVREKEQLVYDTVQSASNGELVLYLDVDMTFLTDTLTDYITETMKDSDMGFQAERNSTRNIGFWCIRCTPQVKKWFKDNFAEIIEAKSDQEKVNEILNKPENTLKLVTFSGEVINAKHLAQEITNRTRVVHATNLKTAKEKIDYLKGIRDSRGQTKKLLTEVHEGKQEMCVLGTKAVLDHILTCSECQKFLPDTLARMIPSPERNTLPAHLHPSRRSSE